VVEPELAMSSSSTVPADLLGIAVCAGGWPSSRASGAGWACSPASSRRCRGRARRVAAGRVGADPDARLRAGADVRPRDRTRGRRAGPGARGGTCRPGPGSWAGGWRAARCRADLMGARDRPGVDTRARPRRLVQPGPVRRGVHRNTVVQAKELGVTLGARRIVLLVPFAPDRFRARYAPGEAVGRQLENCCPPCQVTH
jgi:hypothetical protein